MDIETVDYGPERLVVRLDANGPIDLAELAGSLASLERLFERHRDAGEALSGAPNVRLFVSRLESGSIVAEIAPLLVLLNEPLSFMAATNTIKTFSQNLIDLLRRFAGEDVPVEAVPGDAKELQTFIRPLTGRKAAELGIAHAKYHKRDGDKEILVEYRMNAAEINLASANLGRIADIEDAMDSARTAVRQELKREVLMRLYQASAAQGKERGRTGDRAVIAAVSDRDLPLYFVKQTNDYKKQITEDVEYPFTKGYLVDVNVEFEGDVPKVYHLLHLHKIVDL